jgi:hypothetical protein
LGEASPEDLVLDLQVLHLPSEFFLGGTSDHEQQRLEDVDHVGKLGKPLGIQEFSSFLHSPGEREPFKT